MPRRYDCRWLTCVLTAAASWMISLAAVAGAVPLTGHDLLLIASWLVAVAMPMATLAAHLYPVQLRASDACRAYRLGVSHAQEEAAAHAAARTAIKE